MKKVESKHWSSIYSHTSLPRELFCKVQKSVAHLLLQVYSRFVAYMFKWNQLLLSQSGLFKSVISNKDMGVL